MNAQAVAVNGADSLLRSKLTLSEAPDVAQHLDGSLAPELAPAEAAVRDERDPFIWTETELRLAWGDR